MRVLALPGIDATPALTGASFETDSGWATAQTIDEIGGDRAPGSESNRGAGPLPGDMYVTTRVKMEGSGN